MPPTGAIPTWRIASTRCRRRCLRALKDVADKGKKHGKPVALCGELASQPIGALALAIIGYRSLSLSPSAVGPVKALLLDLDCRKGESAILPFLEQTGGQRVDPPQARGFRRGRGLAALIALPQHRLDALLTRHSLVESELATNLSRDDYVKLSREFSELGPVIEAIKAYRAVTSELADLEALASDTAIDAEMRKLADAEKPALQARRDEAGTANPPRVDSERRDGRPRCHP